MIFNPVRLRVFFFPRDLPIGLFTSSVASAVAMPESVVSASILRIMANRLSFDKPHDMKDPARMSELTDAQKKSLLETAGKWHAEHIKPMMAKAVELESTGVSTQHVVDLYTSVTLGGLLEFMLLVTDDVTDDMLDRLRMALKHLRDMRRQENG